jgi:small GTP-binding protein
MNQSGGFFRRLLTTRAYPCSINVLVCQVRGNSLMITKKVCMIGSFSVGKSALVSRFVYSIFSDTYLSSVGVKISKKDVDSSKGPVKLMLWDLEGRDEYSRVNMSYLRGSMGVIIVADGTREETLSMAMSMHKQAMEILGNVPYLLLINKYDLIDDWEITPDVLKLLEKQKYKIMFASAKTGLNVEEAFKSLTEDMVNAL